MHEFSLMSNIVNKVSEIAITNSCSKVDKIILEIGEISGVIPEHLSFYFEPCTRESFLEGAQMEIEIVIAKAKCNQCDKEFELLSNNFICPLCDKTDWLLLSGKELNIKGIEGY